MLVKHTVIELEEASPRMYLICCPENTNGNDHIALLIKNPTEEQCMLLPGDTIDPETFDKLPVNHRGSYHDSRGDHFYYFNRDGQ